MRAVRVHETGGAEVLTIEDVEDPTPSEGEVLIAVEAIGINFVEVYARRGQIPKELPFTVGGEVAGTVAALGPGVSDFAVGDRVATNAARGAYAELAVAPAGRVVPVPDDVSIEIAASLLVQGLTAHYLATSTFPLGESHTALVHAGAGGVGLILTQIAKRRGARVYTTVSTEEKAALSEAAGADVVIRYTEQDFFDEVRRGSPDGIDVVYDSVGRDTFERGLRLLRPLGMMVLFGESSGPVEPVAPRLLNDLGSLFLTRPSGRHYMPESSQLRARAAEMFAWIQDGGLDIRIGETHPLAEVSTAHTRLESRLTTGKVLLTT